MNYEVGDEVIILSGEGADDYSGGWINAMGKYVGHKMTLRRRAFYKYGWKVEECEWTFDERFFGKDFELNEDDFGNRLDVFFE